MSADTIFQMAATLSAEIRTATPRDINDAIELNAQIADDQSLRSLDRLLFRGFANLLRLYRRKYAIRETFASKSEQRRVEHQQRSKRP